MFRSNRFAVSALSLIVLMSFCSLGIGQEDAVLKRAKDLLKTYRPSVPQVREETQIDPASTWRGAMKNANSDPRVNVMPTYYTWPNREIVVWGNVHWGDSGTGTYEWVVGDSVYTGTVTDDHYIAVNHTFTTFGVKTARLTVTDGDGASDSDEVRINVLADVTETRRLAAIEDGLRYLYTQQYSQGYWYTTSYEYGVGTTGLCILAFENQGHLPANDIDTDIYAEYVKLGLDWLFASSHVGVVDIGMQLAGDPDANGDGKGTYVTSNNYANGIALLAIVASNTPDAVITSGPQTYVNGVTYRQFMINAADCLVWSQTDTTRAGRGGWRYSSSTADYGSSDNSAVQWPALALEAAENSWGIVASGFVKTELAKWLYNSQVKNPRSDDFGGFGYTYDEEIDNITKTGAAICSHSYLKTSASDTAIENAIQFMVNHWNDTSDEYGWREHMNGNYYGMYAVAKGCRTIRYPDGSNIVTIGAHNWYDEYVDYLIYDASYGQDMNGSWPVGQWSGWGGSIEELSTAFGVLILSPGVFELPPVAVVVAADSVPPNSPVDLDGSQSWHQDPDKHILSWKWDFDKSDGVNWNNPDAEGKAVTNGSGYSLPLGVDRDTVYVTLQVTDDSSPTMTDTDEHAIIVNRGNHPPVADAGGPYAAHVGQQITFDGSGSYDPDQGDNIVLYEWDLDGDGAYDDATGVTTTMTWNVEYSGFVRLRVTDSNGAIGESQTTSVWTSLRDLSIATDDLTISNMFPNMGESVTISATIHCHTDQGATVAAVTIRFYDGDPDVVVNPIGSDQEVFNLTDGDSRTVQISWTMPDLDAHDIYVRIDPDGAVEEWNEGNNEVFKTIGSSATAQLYFEPDPCYLFGSVSSVVHLKIRDVKNLLGASISFVFVTNKVELLSISEGSFLYQNNPDNTGFMSDFDNTNGTGSVEFSLLGGIPKGISGGGTIAKLTFKAKVADPSSDLPFGNYTLRDTLNATIDVTHDDGRFEGIGDGDLLCDFDNDDDVDFADYALFLQYWNADPDDLTGDVARYPGPGGAGSPPWSKTNYPFPGEGVIDFEDHVVFALMYNWYKEAVRGGGAKYVSDPEMAGQALVMLKAEASVPVGEVFALRLEVEQVNRLLGAMAQVRFDPDILEVADVEQGPFLGNNGALISMVKGVDAHHGSIEISVVALGGQPLGVDGSGTVAVLRFTPKREGTTDIRIETSGLRDIMNRTIPLMNRNVHLTIGTDAIPSTYHLSQNYPNPFNPETEIQFGFPETGHVRLQIYNLLGQSVRILVDGVRAAGRYSVRWDGRDDAGADLPSGVYFYEFEAGDFLETRRMVLIK